MPVKIAFLTTQFSEVKSGPGRFAEYLRQLEDPALEFHFFSHQVAADSGNQWAVAVPTWLPKLPFSWVFRSIAFALKVKKVSRHHPFDWVLASDYAVAWGLALLGCPTRLAVMVNDDNYLLIYRPGEHRKGISTKNRWARRIGYFFERLAVVKADRVIANSRYTKRLIEEVYHVPPAQSLLLYKAVDLSYFEWMHRPVAPPRRFLFVKNDWRRGGLDLILKVLARLGHQNEITLTVAGISDPEQETVSHLVKESGFGGTVTQQGLIRRPALKQHMSQADVFISMSRQEALGVSCLEAMAAGLPVIATDAGGLPEVLDNGKAGCMVPKNDAEALWQLLNRLESEPEILARNAAHARAHVAHFSVEKLKQNLKEMFG